MRELYILVKRKHRTIENYIVQGFIDTLESSDDNTEDSARIIIIIPTTEIQTNPSYSIKYSSR